ncbi:hypothetical protein COY44_01135, partial [Candidatus Berkelbacteria bacterium CG_4_10_14_0_8_um_filter_39_42]
EHMKNRILRLILLTFASVVFLIIFSGNTFPQPPEPPSQTKPPEPPKQAIWIMMAPATPPADCQIDYEAIIQTPPPLAPANNIAYYQISLKVTLPGNIIGVEFIAPHTLVCRSSATTWAINLEDCYFSHPNLGLLSYISKPNNDLKGLWFENQVVLTGKKPQNGKIVFQKGIQ